MPGPEDEIGAGDRRRCNDAGAWQALDFAGIPGPVFFARESSKLDTLSDKRFGLT